MKKLALLCTILLFTVLTTACSKEPTPEERFSDYIQLWNQQKFAEMYTYLSAEAKKTISEQDFVNRYSKIYTDLEIDNLDIDFKLPKEDDSEQEQVTFPFSVTMDSVAGPINFNHKAALIKEERGEQSNWYIDWDTTYIFPELEKGAKISFHTILSKRGEILDRNGVGLATNGTIYEIGVVPEKLGNQKAETIAKLAALLNMTEEQIHKALNASWVKPHHFVFLKKVSPEDKELLNKLFEFEAVLKKDGLGRVYPYKEVFSHLIGYVGAVTADDLKKHKGYTSSDVIGKRGLEQVLEKTLKGKNGLKISIIKEDGTSFTLVEQQVEDGQDVKLTIDAKLQTQIYEEFEGQAGASGAINPITGETLALVSSPGFNPNKLALGITAKEWKALEEDPLQPLLNRFKSTYAPGSVIKPLTAALGLTLDKISISEEIDIKGKRWQKDKSWGNYYITRVRETSEPVNLEKALVYSDNIYFAQTALKLGSEHFSSGLKVFGFEEELDYLYPMQTSRVGDLNSDIKLADSGYGQGQIEMNVLHLAVSYTPFVNGGNLIKPILHLDKTKDQIWKEAIISKETAGIVSTILTKVVSDPEGTGYRAKIPGYPLAGKTGTAELKQKQGEKGKELGWFVAYNAESPQLLISMMMEDVQNLGGSEVVVKKVKNVFQATR